jgi:hypothetical protein
MAWHSFANGTIAEPVPRATNSRGGQEASSLPASGGHASLQIPRLLMPVQCASAEGPEEKEKHSGSRVCYYIVNAVAENVHVPRTRWMMNMLIAIFNRDLADAWEWKRGRTEFLPSELRQSQRAVDD